MPQHPVAVNGPIRNLRSRRPRADANGAVRRHRQLAADDWQLTRARAAPNEGMDGYYRLSRTHSYSLLFALPLLLAYEAGAMWLSAGAGASLRNGADVLLRTLLAAGGVTGTLALTGALIVVALVLIGVERRRRDVPLRGSVFLGMALESLGYAVALGVVIGTATQWLLELMPMRMAADATPIANLPFLQVLVLSLGAGIYEELVFRVLLVGGAYALLHHGGLPRRQAIAFAVVLSAIVFSVFHYIGPYGDPWALPSFTFRFLAGLAFSLLFVLRGFGIAAWSHALYDVIVLLARSA